MASRKEESSQLWACGGLDTIMAGNTLRLESQVVQSPGKKCKSYPQSQEPLTGSYKILFFINFFYLGSHIRAFETREILLHTQEHQVVELAVTVQQWGTQLNAGEDRTGHSQHQGQCPKLQRQWLEKKHIKKLGVTEAVKTLVIQVINQDWKKWRCIRQCMHTQRRRQCSAHTAMDQYL